MPYAAAFVHVVADNLQNWTCINHLPLKPSLIPTSLGQVASPFALLTALNLLLFVVIYVLESLPPSQDYK